MPGKRVPPTPDCGSRRQTTLVVCPLFRRQALNLGNSLSAFPRYKTFRMSGGRFDSFSSLSVEAGSSAGKSVPNKYWEE